MTNTSTLPEPVPCAYCGCYHTYSIDYCREQRNRDFRSFGEPVSTEPIKGKDERLADKDRAIQQLEEKVRVLSEESEKRRKIIVDCTKADIDYITSLQSQLEQSKKAVEDLRSIIPEVNKLCQTIVNSPPDTHIKGEIESMAFMLENYLIVLDKRGKP
jgi:hypothetical protein